MAAVLRCQKRLLQTLGRSSGGHDGFPNQTGPMATCLKDSFLLLRGTDMSDDPMALA
jgi:hypothetical protein